VRRALAAAVVAGAVLSLQAAQSPDDVSRAAWQQVDLASGRVLDASLADRRVSRQVQSNKQQRVDDEYDCDAVRLLHLLNHLTQVGNGFSTPTHLTFLSFLFDRK